MNLFNHSKSFFRTTIVFFLLVLCNVLNSTASVYEVFTDITNPQSVFASQEIAKALQSKGNEVEILSLDDFQKNKTLASAIILTTLGDKPMMGKMRKSGSSPDLSMKKEGFCIRKGKNSEIWVVGKDAAGPKLLEIWQNASMIYPLVTGFHWCALDFQWYIESGQSRPDPAQTPSGYHDVNRFISLPPHKGTDNVSIPEYVKAMAAKTPVKGTSPIKLTNQIVDCTDKSLNGVRQIQSNTLIGRKRMPTFFTTLHPMVENYSFRQWSQRPVVQF
jgi:hypothetical protein